MRAICFDGVRRVALRDVPEPRLEAPTDAVVQVQWAGLCGSDLHVYLGRETGLDPGTVMGHEFVGRVVAVGEQVRAIRVGDRVAAPFSTNCGTCFFCRVGLTSRCANGQLFGWRSRGVGLHGGQAELVRVPLADATLLPIGDTISSIAAILLGDNLSTGFFCADLAELAPQHVCAVVGCGTVGLMSIVAARQKGVQTVFAIDQIDHRRQHAARLGAIPLTPEEASDAVRQATNGLGADAVMELVGLPDAQRLAFEILRTGGTLGVVGCHCERQFAFSPVEAYDKNLTYRTGRCPARTYMDQLFPVLRERRLEVDSFLTHTFRIEECAHAYDLFATRRENCLKVVFAMEL